MKRRSEAILLKTMPAGTQKKSKPAEGKKNAFKAEKKLQSGTLPYLIKPDGSIQVMLVTRTHGDAWILPKGNIAENMTFAESAAKEAYEEAGIIGECDPVMIGTYAGQSQLIRIYPLRITRILEHWEELGKRERRLFDLDDAAEAVENDGIRSILHKLREYLEERSAS